VYKALLLSRNMSLTFMDFLLLSGEPNAANIAHNKPTS
jgi:hypothetical protein